MPLSLSAVRSLVRNIDCAGSGQFSRVTKNTSISSVKYGISGN